MNAHDPASPAETEAPAVPLPKGEAQEPLWRSLASLAGDIRWMHADAAKPLLKKIDVLIDQIRADLVREWHRGHETGIREERERIRRVLLGRVGALRAEQSRRSREAADFTHRAHKAAEKEAEAMTMADAIEAAALGLTDGEGHAAP